MGTILQLITSPMIQLSRRRHLYSTYRNPRSNESVTKSTLAVTAEDVDRELDMLCRQAAQITAVEDAAIEANDVIIGDVALFAGHDVDADADRIEYLPDSHIFVTGKEQDYEGNVAGIVVDDLGTRLIGKTGGDEVTIEVTGPGGHENESIRDQPITIRISIGRINRLVPATIEELQRRYAFDSTEELRSQFEDSIVARQQSEQTAELHEQICEYLDANVELELPAGVTGRQVDRMLKRQALTLAQMDVPEQEIERRLAEARQSSQDEARRSLKLFFIIERAAHELKIEVTEGEVNGRIAQMAVRQGRRPEKLRQEMHRNGQLEHLYLSIREQKTLDQILATAEVTERDAPAPGAEATATPPADDAAPAETKAPPVAAEADAQARQADGEAEKAEQDDEASA